MPRLEIVPFSDEHLDEAGGLLAARHAHHRRTEPLLPARYEDPAEAAREVAAAWSREGASGAAALRDGRLVGFLLGAPRDPGVWGDNVWVEASGQAVAEAEDARDLYAAAAAGWVEAGRSRHYVLVPATDASLLDAWFRLGFGQQQAHAMQEITFVEPRVPDGFEIREPREGDVEALLAVELALPTHQRSSPVFSGISLPGEDGMRAEWQSTLAGNDDETVLIGLRDDRPVACWSFAPAASSIHYQGLMQSERASYLAFASTLPEARGSGVGRALTDATFAAAAARGYTAMVTDWRVTNLLASRFWPKRGFRTAFLRLYRSIP
jgi:ribosomal protein S18 acetylase RimI-like enzyme